MELQPRAHRNREEYARLRAYGWLWALFSSALAVTFVFTFLFIAVRAEDAGMAPYIEQYDIVLYFRPARLLRAPARGDVLLFSGEKNGSASVGRAVGMPGETVEIVGGRVYINGYLLDESAYVTSDCADMSPTRVPEGCYFVLPDARAWANAQNPAELVVSGNDIAGRAFLRVYPIGRAALFK